MPFQIPPNNQRQFQVTFQSAQASSYNNSLIIDSDYPQKQHGTLHQKGQRVRATPRPSDLTTGQPKIDVTPPLTLDFGNVSSPSQKPVTIKNTGTRVLNVRHIKLSNT